MSASRAARALPLVSAAVTALAWWPLAGFVPDDTYIHLQYAKHLRDGHGLVFNLGERVYASTSPLWSTFLALLGFLGIDLEAAAVGASFVAALLASAFAARLFARLLPVPAAGCAAILFAVDVWFVRWAGSGMETSLAVLLVVLGFDRYVATAPWGARPRAAGTWWALAALVRPEAAILPGLLALRSALDPRPGRARRVLEAIGPFVLLFGGWTAFARAYYGTALPVTIHAKSIEGQGWSGALANIALMGSELAASRPLELGAAGIALVAFVIARRRVDVAHLVPAGWLVGLPLFYAATGVPGVTRYLVPVTPVLVYYGWKALAGLLASRARAAYAATALAAASVGVFAMATHVVPQAHAFRQGVAQTWIAQGRWFAAHTPPGTRVALRDIGAFAYFSDRPVLDLGGLVSPEIVPLLQAHTYDALAVGLRFADVARPAYFLDVATEPARMTRDSPFAACLTALDEARLDHRALRKREAAWVSGYRIDWACFDSTRKANATSR